MDVVEQASKALGNDRPVYAHEIADGRVLLHVGEAAPLVWEIEKGEKGKAGKGDESVSVPRAGGGEPATPACAGVDDVGKVDDLTVITGIGKTTAERLAAAGVTTFAALAAADSEDLAKAIKMHVSAVRDWQVSARMLARSEK